MKKKYDLAEEMIKIMKAEAAEEHTHDVKVTAAFNFMNQASELLDNLGEHQKSEIITRVLERIANKLG